MKYRLHLYFLMYVNKDENATEIPYYEVFPAFPLRYGMWCVGIAFNLKTINGF